MSYSMENAGEVERLELQATQKGYSIAEELSHLRVKDGAHCLDVGCGSGILGRQLMEKAKNLVVECCDISELRIHQAKKMRENQDMFFFAHDIMSEEVPRQFDLISARYVLEHLDKPLFAIHNMKKSLKDGGQIFLINFDGIFFNFFTKSSFLNNSLEKIKNNVSFDLYVGRKLPTMLKALNFKDIKWNVSVHQFSDEELELEYINVMRRIDQARPLIEQILGGPKAFSDFKRCYLEELKDSSNTLFYNKFIVSGKK